MRFLTTSVLFTLLMVPSFVHAEEMAKPDDRVSFQISAEDWATTKTARVTANVEAAVSGANTGTMRADMMKAVGGLAQADWRLVEFNRSQDQTGLERWSASFEARLPETALGGLSDNAKKSSKAGMQLTIADIDFTPTLDEVETVRANVRTQLYKKVADQLTALNSTMPGRSYRVAAIDFMSENIATPMLRMAKAPMAMMAQAAPEQPAVERAEKIKLTANVVYAAVPTPAEAKH